MIRRWKGRDPKVDTGPEHYEVTYEGAVLSEYERNGHDDSDFYAVVWDEDEQVVKTVQWGTTRAWTYNNNATVDATPEVIEKAAAYLGKQRAELAAANANAQARVPEKGRRVRVRKGRKVPIGTEGEVFWVGLDHYNTSKWNNVYRIGFKTDSGEKHFTAMANVEVVNPETFTVDQFPQKSYDFHRPGDAAFGYTMATVEAEMRADHGYGKGRV